MRSRYGSLCFERQSIGWERQTASLSEGQVATDGNSEHICWQTKKFPHKAGWMYKKDLITKFFL